MVSSQTLTLSSRNIPAVGRANKIFGDDNTLLVARPGRACCNLFWFTVPEGFYALVTRHGADVDYEDGSPVWPPGLHIGPPWLKVSHLVTMQSIVLQTPIKGCKTKDNVTVEIDVTLVLRVMGDKNRLGDDPYNVRKFVHMVTAMGLQQQLQDAQAEAIRTLARSVTHTEVFGLRSVGHTELQGVLNDLDKKLTSASVPQPELGFSGEESKEFIPSLNDGASKEDLQEEKDMLGDHDVDDELEAEFAVERGANVTKVMKNRLNKQFKPQGIEIMDVIIQNISLPDEIQSQMSQKTMVISQNAEQRMQQKHDLLVLEQNEAIITLKQSHKEQKLELLEDGLQNASIMQLELDHERALGTASLDNIITKMNVDVSKVIAESDLTVQRIRNITKLEAERIELEAQTESSRIHADALAQAQDIDAKAELKCSQLQSLADRAIFQAEGDIASKMKTYNDHYTKMKKIAVNESLAKNHKLIVTGTSGGDSANRLVLADAALSTMKEENSFFNTYNNISAAERSRMLSEFAVAGGNAQVRIHVGGSEEGSTK